MLGIIYSVALISSHRSFLPNVHAVTPWCCNLIIKGCALGSYYIRTRSTPSIIINYSIRMDDPIGTSYRPLSCRSSLDNQGLKKIGLDIFPLADTPLTPVNISSISLSPRPREHLTGRLPVAWEGYTKLKPRYHGWVENSPPLRRNLKTWANLAVITWL